MKFNFLLLLVFALTITCVSAWPVELYDNGTWVDLNSSDNGTANISINYYTYQNVTNVTEYNNVTQNITQDITGNLTSYYNKSETDARYLRTGSQYANTELFNRAELTERLNNLTATDANLTAQLDEIDKTPTGWLWFSIFLVACMAIGALVLIGRDNNGY